MSATTTKLDKVPNYAKRYPYVYLWEVEVMHSPANGWYVKTCVDDAIADNAPLNAIFKSGKVWHTLDGCRNPAAFISMGVSIPQKFNYALRLNLHTFFKDSLDREKVENEIRTLLMSYDMKEPEDFFTMNHDWIHTDEIDSR